MCIRDNAYAEQHSERVSAMVLVSVTMTRPLDIHWLYHEAGRYFPEQWQRFRAGVPEAERDGDLVAGYYRLLNEPADAAVRARAAKGWCDWEDAVVSLEEGWVPHHRYADPAFRMTFARLVTHYFHHRAWLADGQLLRDAHRLEGIPAVLIHGRRDLGGPADTAWQLAEAWPGAELWFVGTGHRLSLIHIFRIRPRRPPADHDRPGRAHGRGRHGDRRGTRRAVGYWVSDAVDAGSAPRSASFGTSSMRRIV